MPRIVVGLSGGVDSAFAATLLQERGFDVVGCYLKVAVDGAPCPWKEDLPMAHRVAAHLNIPLVVKDVSASFEHEVLEPMVAAYQSGETPNPDILCNRWVKFDALIAVAREVGAERIATGHYARVVRNAPNPVVIASEAKPSAAIPSNTVPGLLRRVAPRNDAGEIELHRGLDYAKDQSYFLATLTQEQFRVAEFPLGEWRKEDVRAEAKRRGLPNWDRESTSGVCFLGHLNLANFLSLRGRSRSNLGHSSSTPATVITTTGEVLGTVPNAEALTIGQRIPIGGQSAPRYVVANSPTLSVGEPRRIVVSATPDDPARLVSVVHATDPHWIGSVSPLASGRGSVRGSFRCSARIRHRQEPQPCSVSLRGAARGSNPGLEVRFDASLTGVAPGQAIVFSDGDRILGSATIDRRRTS